MAAPKTIAEPEKELRFTRSAQGRRFAILSAISTAATLVLAVAFAMNWEPVSRYFWLAIPLGFAVMFGLLAARCLRHAYIILSPLGIELFPFFKARENLQIIYWSDLHHAEVSDDLQHLKIHRDAAHTSGIVATLSPLAPQQRALLKRAVDGRMA